MRVIVSTVAVAVTLVSMPLASADNPSWKRGVPGARAFLDKDGSDGSDEAVLCNTLKEYIEWREELPPSGVTWDKAPVIPCHEFPLGLPARLDQIFPDPTRVSGSGLNLPIARVTFESRHYSGFMGLLGLKPVILPGASVHYDGKGLGQASLDSSPNSGYNDTATDGVVTVRGCDTCWLQRFTSFTCRSSPGRWSAREAGCRLLEVRRPTGTRLSGSMRWLRRQMIGKFYAPAHVLAPDHHSMQGSFTRTQRKRLSLTLMSSLVEGAGMPDSISDVN